MKKKRLIIIILLIIIVGLVMTYFFLPKKYAVLTYHDFTEGKPQNNMQKNIDEFEREMKYLSKHNYKTLTLKDVECYFDGKCKLPRKSVLITMDDGWKGEYKLALPILKKYNLNAIIFYIGSNYDGNNENFISKEEIEDIKKNYPNIEIASHSYDMHYENAYLQQEDILNKDIKNMKNIIKSNYFAYPFGKNSTLYKKVLKDNGYKLAFGFGPNKMNRKFSKKDDRYNIPRLNISTTYSYYKFILRLVSPF